MAPDSDANERSAERERMVREQLAGRGVAASRVLDAMRSVPREWFMAADLQGRAYSDAAHPIDCGQTISQPYMVARMTECLALSGGERVLEIGTGSGYQTSILALLAGHIYTVEWHLLLMNKAADCLARLSLANVTYRCGDGSVGWPEHAPYEAILVAAGAPEVPEALCEQLADGGRLVIPVGDAHEQTLITVTRCGDHYERDVGLRCRFVKLVGQAGWQAR